VSVRDGRLVSSAVERSSEPSRGTEAVPV